MAIQLQEMHPALVHLPIALLPLAVGADVIGSLTDNDSLLSFGQKAIGVAAVGAIGSAVTGLIAGEEVNVEGASEDMLITHRNLNFIATLVATGMALWRFKHRKPNAAYLGVGAVGVEPAKGVYRKDAPALKSGQIGSFAKTAGTDLVHGVQHMAQEVAKGRLIPTLIASLRKQPRASVLATAETPT